MALAHGVIGEAFVGAQELSVHVVNWARRRIGNKRGNPFWGKTKVLAFPKAAGSKSEFRC